MKSKLIRTGLIALALTLAVPVTMAPAQEISSLYVTPKLSYSFQKGDIAGGGKDDDKGFGLGAAVGADFGYYYEVPLRVELEYMYRTEAKFGSISQHKVAAHSLMGNAFFDITTQSAFTPYVGAGLGLAYLDTDYRYGTAGSSSGTNWNLAWSLMAGVGYSLSETMTLDMGYRYIDLGQGDSGGFPSPAVDYTAHELGVGLRFSGF